MDQPNSDQEKEGHRSLLGYVVIFVALVMVMFIIPFLLHSTFKFYTKLHEMTHINLPMDFFGISLSAVLERRYE